MHSDSLGFLAFTGRFYRTNLLYLDRRGLHGWNFAPTDADLGCRIIVGAFNGGPILLRSLGINLPVVYIGLHLSFLFCGLLLRLTVIEKERGTLSAALVLIIVQMGIIVSIGDFSLARNDTFFIVGKLPVIASYLAAYSVFLLSLWTMRPQSKLLSSTGEISYSIYLFHVPVCWTIYLLLPPTGL